MARIESLVQWHEGMLISPQHFQQANNYLQMILGQSCAAYSPFYYGLFDLRIDSASLSSGLIRVLKARGLFQDGLFFDFDTAEDEPLELNLSEYFSTNTSAIKIYLAVPSRRCGENMLQGEMARYYSSEMLNVEDENLGDNAINIPTLKPKLRLLTENRVDGRYQSFPIIEVEKSLEGGIVMTSFAAPFLSLMEHAKILYLCRDVVQAIRDKIAYFADREENFEQNQAEESLTNLRLLIMSVLPLESILKVKGLHPFEVFKCFLQTVAGIVAVHPNQMIPRLPVYDHNNIYESFYQLYSFSLEILNQLKQKYSIIRFTRNGNMFTLNIKPEWLQSSEIVIGIQRPFSVSSDDILTWISGLQIASESMIASMKDKRVLGAERRVLERGQYITQPAGMTAIAVKTSSAYIRIDEKLCLTSTVANIIPEEVVLYAERP